MVSVFKLCVTCHFRYLFLFTVKGNTNGYTKIVLLRFSKTCKRTVSDGFVTKSADSDSVSDSRWRQPQADAPCARQQCRGSNHLGRSPGKARTHRPAGRDRTSPRCSTLHCPICARTDAAASAASDNYLKLRSDACLDWYDWPDSGEGRQRVCLISHTAAPAATHSWRNVAWTAPPDK